jgi:GrpB-like predicted nucleotidyltransferase (UPF0157 family)
MIGLTRGAVALEPYSPEWPELFRREAERLRAALGDLATAIEHVGSTSVPGLDSKPLIDMAVAVRDWPAADRCRPLLQDLGYEYVPHASQVGRLFFALGTPTFRTHHLHLVLANDPQFRGWLLLRDRLRADPRLRDRYQRLKRALAARFPDRREEYTSRKSRFVEMVTNRLLAEEATSSQPKGAGS